MPEVTQPEKRKRGRPRGSGNHTNQYTGVRARNVEYVRQMLRSFLEGEVAKGTGLTKATLSACRMLLACDNVFMYFPSVENRALRRLQAQQRLLKFAEGVKSGASLPQLLAEMRSLEDDEDSRAF